MRIMIINGPNMNMLGIREKEIYGEKTYSDLIELIEGHCYKNGIECEFFQSNHEGDIVDIIQKAYNRIDGIVINPAAFTHYSIAIADALASVGVPYVEVHISDIDNREDFRKVSVIRDKALTVVKGKGFNGYIDAVNVLKDTVIK